MNRRSSSFASSSRFAAVLVGGVIGLCATTAIASEPAAAPAPAAATAPATVSGSTQVTTPAGGPSVVVVNTTVPAPVVAPAPAPAAAPAPVPAPQASWTVPVEPAPAVAVPSRIAIELHPQPMAVPSREQQEYSRRMADVSRARSLKVAGWATLGSTYAFSALIGTIAIDTAQRDRMQSYGYSMLIPVAGPFAAAFQTRSATGALVTISLGVAQAAGLGMALVGGARHRRLKREIGFTAMPTRGGGHVGMSMRF